MSLIPVLRSKWSSANLKLVYVVSPRPARAGETLSLKNKGNPFVVGHSGTMPVTQYSGGRGKGMASSRPAWAV